MEGPASVFSEAAREEMVKPDPTKLFHHARLPDGSIYLKWSGLFEFLASSDGRRVTGRPLSEASCESFQTYLLGQVLSFALLKQGIEPLHSTAVVIDGGAVSFIGDCGYGKSSLGAAFLQAGYPLLTDDLLVVKQHSHGFSAYPGPSRIKLFPEIARRLLGEHLNGTVMNHLTPKLIIPLDRHQSCPAAVPLKTIYVLAPPATNSRRNQPAIRNLSPRKAFLELVRNTFNTVVTEPDRLQRQFSFATRLVAKTPIRLLSYPGTVDSLSWVRDAILRDLIR